MNDHAKSAVISVAFAVLIRRIDSILKTHVGWEFFGLQATPITKIDS
jgi:hypothetical protein